MTSQNFLHDKFKKLKKLSEMLINFMDQIYKGSYTVDGEKIEGWRFLPRICIKMYTLDTFLYSVLSEGHDRPGNHLKLWSDILYETFQIYLFSQQLILTEA